MIEINARKLRPDDIGRKLKVKKHEDNGREGHEGVVANYTNFAGHVEVVFEDGHRAELSPADSLLYDDSITITVSSEELKSFIEYHPLKRKHDSAMDQWRTKLQFSFRDRPDQPEYPEKLKELEKLYDQIKRVGLH